MGAEEGCTSIQVLWSNCKVTDSVFPDASPKPILAPNKGSKQDQPGITTQSWLPHQEPLWFDRAVSWTH